MQSTKRYTNQTFTKRVDHEGGLHRPPAAPEEPAVCAVCGIVYEDRRWTKHSIKAHEPWKPAISVTCPACKQMESGVVGGYVTLGGHFLHEHRDDIEHLLANETERAQEDNPLARIMNKRYDAGRLMIQTTTEHLAQRLGHALEKAYDGDVTFAFSHENKVAHVDWHRD